jgi:hypothetical protein
MANYSSGPHPATAETHRLAGALIVLMTIAAGCVGVATSASPSQSAQPTEQIPSDKQSRFDYLASLRSITPPPDQPSKSPGAGLVTLPPSSESPYSPYEQVPAGSGFIVQSDLGPPGQHDAVYKNDWYETTDAGITEVYAGGETGDTSIGFVFVATWDSDHANLLTSEEYKTPEHDGPVTITGATGDVLELTAADGTIFHFDVSGRAYR